MQVLKTFVSILVKAAKGWSEDKITVWSAALSYYTVFSLAPLLLIVVSLAGFFFGKEAVRGELMGQLDSVLGKNGAAFVQDILKHSTNKTANSISAIISLVTLVLGASGVFGQIKETLNTVWGVTTKKSAGIFGMIRSRFLSFSMVLVIGFLLMVSLILSSVIHIVQSSFSRYLPFPALLIETANFLVSYLLITILFGLLYKVLPDVQVKWKYALIGGAFTSLLFTIGKTILGIYIGSSGVTSTYGAAASLVVILLWVYYSSQILFFGAEFSKYLTLHYEKQITPSKYGKLEAEKGVAQSKEQTPRSPIIPLSLIILGLIYAIKFTAVFLRKKKNEEKKKH